MTTKVDRAREAAVDREVANLSGEFSGVFSAETIRRYVRESVESPAGARLAQFTPLFALRFTRERLNALAQAQQKASKDVPEILFVCIHNAGRSQMAAGLTKSLAADRVHVRTAGSEPDDQLNPAVVQAMAEVGVDLTEEFPKPLTDEFVEAADVVITMGCGDACPIFPGKRYADWDLEDPSSKDLETVRGIRDQVEERVRALIAELAPAAADRS